VADFTEENWPSMDRVAETLADLLAVNHTADVTPFLVRPRFRRRFSTRSRVNASLLGNADRLLNRFVDYPATLRRQRDQFDLFHIVDHSYAHLVHYLPSDRTCVSCHDIETFRCILEPKSERRSAPFRMMTRRILSGLKRAAIIACDSEATRQEVVRRRIVEDTGVTVIYNGVGAVFSPPANSSADAEADRMLGPADRTKIELLNVGSTVRRKRIDVLLRAFVELRRTWPSLRLVRVGGQFTPEQQALVAELRVTGAIAVLPRISDAVLAAVYRRAALVLMPSEVEGFGLPLLEAMACGTPVLASDIAALREVGGGAAEYASTASVSEWSEAAERLLSERQNDPVHWSARVDRARRRAAEFSWDDWAAKTVAMYRTLMGAET
jgi:glycosyltransferase involved in cell wall biosynthesis